MLVRVLTKSGICIGSIPSVRVLDGNEIVKIGMFSERENVVRRIDNSFVEDEKLYTFTVQIVHDFYVLIEGDIDRVKQYCRKYKE